MAHFVGLDVPVKETSVCIVDGAGKVISPVRHHQPERKKGDCMKAEA